MRAYATNSKGTAYGAAESFKTLAISGGITYGSMTDQDGNTYKTVTIGALTWMAENLKTTKYRNGELIGTTTPATLDITSEATPKYQWAYAGVEANAAIYGRLYTWYATTDSRNIAPAGWHVATDAEWMTLITNNGIGIGGMYQEVGSEHWIIGNTNATNSTGFTALPSGQRFSGSPFFLAKGQVSMWWSATDPGSAKAKEFGVAENFVYGEISKKYACAVRCVKD